MTVTGLPRQFRTMTGAVAVSSISFFDYNGHLISSETFEIFFIKNTITFDLKTHELQFP
jgi:hypothetical protein